MGFSFLRRIIRDYNETIIFLERNDFYEEDEKDYELV